MPKILKDGSNPCTSYPFSMRQSDLLIINTHGIGKNPSERLRDILAKVEIQAGGVAHSDGAILAYREGDGEKVWAGNIPEEIVFDKRKGITALEEAALRMNWRVQLVENSNTDEKEFWIAPPKIIRDCKVCKRSVLTAVEAAFGQN